MNLGKDRDEFHQIVGSMLRDIRSVRKLSRADVGMVTGMHGTGLRRIETGDSEIKTFDFIQLCRTYKIDPRDLLEEFMETAPPAEPLTVTIGGKTYSLQEVTE